MELQVAGPDDETLVLDLLNTTPVVDGVPTDLLTSEWLAAHQIDESERAGLTAAREVLQAVVRGEQPVSGLQPFLDGVAVQPAATDDGIDWQLQAVDAAARAVIAWDTLRINSPGRLRPCANSECHLFLLDRSKPNTARWCSMAICGNRMKARRHYRRTHPD
ncbi:CGNR zinc finger domain-containing protein [Mycolicibacterium sp. 3033]|nr:CGNR zinc finger domain-containing protein [Mycolicibacterium aurantiacum]